MVKRRDFRSRFQPNFPRILESILYVISKWPDDVRKYATQYDIVKTIFVADMLHTEEYGRPVTFDNYSALPFGPVPEETYDALKPEYKFFSRNFGIKVAPWSVRPIPFQKARAYTAISRKPDLNILSKSDTKALDSAISTVRQLGFGGVKDWTHDHPAWKSAWEEKGDKFSSPMIFEEIVQDLDDEEMKDLVHASKHMA